VIIVLRICNGLHVPLHLAMKHFLVLFFMGFVAVSSAQERTVVAMITAFQGTVNLITPQGIQVLQPFSRLQRGDQLAVDTPALKLIYFDSGRQEIWQGKGKIEILAAESRGLGFLNPDVIILPSFIVRQIGKTPSADASLHAGSMRSRSIGAGNSIEKIENSYRRMRMEAVQGDLNPELFLLSALFEMREIDRVEQVLSDLRAARPADQEARIVIALYQKAVKNFRQGGGKQ
jgi:hypothetical protein